MNYEALRQIWQLSASAPSGTYLRHMSRRRSAATFRLALLNLCARPAALEQRLFP